MVKPQHRKGLSLERFSKAKQHDPRYSRKLKQKEFERKAKIISSYRRLRKRELGQDLEKKEENTEKKDEPKTRFVKAKDSAAELERKKQEKEQERLDREKEAKRKRKQREKLSKRLNQKNKKGQPVLKHHINNLLAKIQHDVCK